MRTEHQQFVVFDYLSKLKCVLKLCDWTIDLSDEFCDDECNAMIDPVCGRKLATLYLNKSFCDYSVEKQVHSLVHELIHLHHISATDIIRVDLPRHLSQSCYEILWSGFKRQIEYCVDGLADAVCSLVPPIDYNIKSETTGGEDQ